jgi:hypothetical protein
MEIRMNSDFRYYLLEAFLNAHEGIRYTKPDFEDEIHEFHRVANHFNIDIHHIKSAYEKAKAEPLTKNITDRLENTDANDDTLTIANSKQRLAKYGRSASRQRYAAYQFKNKKVETPIILHHKESNTYHLVAGNTRLMYAKLHKITPMVHVVHI